MSEEIEIHKALADDTRYRLYRYLRLSGRPVSIRELAARLSLHPNTLRPHLRRLEEVDLVKSEVHRGAAVGRPQTLYSAIDRDGRQGRDYRLLADILCGVLAGKRNRERAGVLAHEWGVYLAGRTTRKPRARRRSGLDLATLREALAEAGFEPRFHRSSADAVEIVLRECPFRDLLEEHGELVCTVHRGLLEGILAASRPPLSLTTFEPAPDRPCRLTARAD